MHYFFSSHFAFSRFICTFAHLLSVFGIHFNKMYMQFPTIATEIQGSTFIITINRPESMNALNSQVITDLDAAIDHLIHTPELRGAIITGAGEKAFVAGADIAEINSLGEGEALAYGRRGQAVFSKIERSGKPVIAAIGGFALGGGCELAMACHLRIASEKARFGQPEVKLGLIAGYGGTQRLPRLVGLGKAIELLLTAEMIGAEKAMELGLVNYVCDHGKQVKKSLEMLEAIYAQSPLAVALTLDAIRAGLTHPDTGFAHEAQNFSRAAESHDGKEGTKAFLEKRKANFKGE